MFIGGVGCYVHMYTVHISSMLTEAGDSASEGGGELGEGHGGHWSMEQGEVSGGGSEHQTPLSLSTTHLWLGGGGVEVVKNM